MLAKLFALLREFNVITAIAMIASIMLTNFRLESRQMAYLIVVAFAVIAVYQWLKHAKQNLITVCSLISLCFASLFYVCDDLNMNVCIYFLLAAIITVAYKSDWRFSLRRSPILKVCAVAAVWTIVSVVIPLELSPVEIDFWYVTARFVLLVCLVLLFEIADFSTDLGRTVTVAQLIPNAALKTLVAVFGVASIMVIFSENQSLPFFSSFYFLMLVAKSKRGNRIFADVFVELFPVVLCVDFYWAAKLL